MQDDAIFLVLEREVHTGYKTAGGDVVILRPDKASAFEAVDSAVIWSRVRPMVLKLVSYSFFARRSTLEGQCGERTCCGVGKGF